MIITVLFFNCFAFSTLSYCLVCRVEGERVTMVTGYRDQLQIFYVTYFAGVALSCEKIAEIHT